MHLIKAGLVYCGLTFLAGLLLGPIRVFFVEPHLGPFLATLLEAPLMLAAMTLVCLWCVNYFQIGSDIASRLTMGIVAFLCLILFEFSGALILRGQSLADHAAGFATPQGMLSLALFIFFAVLPAILPLIAAKFRS